MDDKFYGVRRRLFIPFGVAGRACAVAASMASLGLACSSASPDSVKRGLGGQGGASQGWQAGQQSQAGSGGFLPVDMTDAAAGQHGGSAPSDAGGGGGGLGQVGGSGGLEQAGGAGGLGQAGGSGGLGQAGGAGLGKVLYIAGAMPMVGLDLQIHDVLKARNMDVEDIRESAVLPSNAQGKQLIVVSYSILSTDFKAADFASVAVPLIVMEDHSLAALGMTAADGFGSQDGVTQITITSDEPTLTAGLPMGDVTVYSSVTEVFWGIPGPGALKIAAVKGDPAHAVTFAYPTGSMMVGRVAPAKRVQIFVAGHAPPPNSKLFLSSDGLKLVDAAVAWSTL